MSASARRARRAMVRAYAEVLECEAEKKRLLPELLIHLIPDQAWIQSVAKANAARSNFESASRTYCAVLTQQTTHSQQDHL